MARIVLEQVTKRFPVGRNLFTRRPGALTPAPEDGEAGDAAATVALALDHLDLTVENGETVALVGPSGSGKSTLLRVVAGLEQSDSGRVLYDDRDMADVPPKDRGIGMVFQNYALYPHMESHGNLAFTFRVRKREDEIPERVRVVSEIMGVGFKELLDRKPKQLSGGEQQRVAIARCIVRDPTLFLLDEPLSNLDAKLRVRTRIEIKRLLRRFAITTLYVTHDQTEAFALGDRIAVLRRGRVEQIGRYGELRDTPVNLFVATFIGSPPMNVLPATISAGSLLVQQGRLPLRPGWEAARQGEVLLGIRPEDARIGEGNGHLRLAVEVVQPLVQERMLLLHGTVDGAAFVAVVDASAEVRRGDVVPLTLDAERLHLFDAVTQARIETR